MFYPADWRKDPELRVCSIGARGLWIDMIALMHEGDPYGHLVVNGVPISDEQLARLVGEPVKLVKKLLEELESHNVFSRNADGVAFSRRMVADEHIREVRAASGKLGGNPKLLHKGEDNGVVKVLDKQTVKEKGTPSVAVAVSLAEKPPRRRTARVQTEGPAFDLAPYLTAYSTRFPGSKVSGGRFAPTFKALEAMHGPAETLRRWGIFLAAKGQLGPEYFARTWSEWGGESQSDERPRVLAATEMLLP